VGRRGRESVKYRITCNVMIVCILALDEGGRLGRGLRNKRGEKRVEVRGGKSRKESKKKRRTHIDSTHTYRLCISRMLLNKLRKP